LVESRVAEDCWCESHSGCVMLAFVDVLVAGTHHRRANTHAGYVLERFGVVDKVPKALGP
jgi:hypothetical protein